MLPDYSHGLINLPRQYLHFPLTMSTPDEFQKAPVLLKKEVTDSIYRFLPLSVVCPTPRDCQKNCIVSSISLGKHFVVSGTPFYVSSSYEWRKTDGKFMAFLQEQ